MKTSITFFTVNFFSFFLHAAETNCSTEKGQTAQSNCYKAEYAGPVYPNYQPPGTSTKPPPIAPAPVQPQPTVATLESCLRKWDQKARECLSSAEVAKKSCDQKNADSGSNQVQNYTKGITDSSISKNTGKGSSDECAKISLIGNTALTGMNLFKQTCDDDFAKCSSDCSQVIAASEGPVIANECLPSNASDQEKIQVSDTIVKIINASQNGRNICMVEAKAERNIMDDLLSAISKSTKAGKVCACKFSPDSNGNCEAIPNPKDCLTGGALAGTSACNVYANDNCALGSAQFNSVPCQCARDSSAAVCRTAAAIPISNFAMDLKASPGGISAGADGLVGAGDAGSNLNLSGGYNVNKPASELKPDDKDKTTGGGGYAGGNGSAGGSGSSASGGNNDPSAAAQEEDGSSKTGLAGLFNQVKSSFGNNKTGSNNKNKGFGNRASSASDSNYDVDKWRPRGPAGANCQSSQMRCKNEDIFSVMNKRYHVIGMSFIQTP